MEPISSTLAAGASDFAASQATELLQQAKHRRADDFGRCEKYLEAAKVAIKGLEEEYTGILIDASHTNGDPARIEALKLRLDTYLASERFCPLLHEAIAGLQFYRGKFATHASSFRQWPWKRKDRTAAVKKFGKYLIRSRSTLPNSKPKGTVLTMPPKMTARR